MGSRKIIGVSGGRDENGIVTLTQPWHCDTLKECFEVGDRTLLGLPETSRNLGTWDQTIEAGFQVGVTYQGPDPDRAESEETFDFADSWSSEPIETHWAINTLISDYGGRLVDTGDDIRLVMPKDVPEGSVESKGGGFTLTAAGQEFADRNPHFGHKSYELFGGIWTHTYVRRRMPQNVLEGIGGIVAKPPGNPPTPKGRDWAKMAPSLTIYKNGAGVRITDKYKLSPPGGWPPGFYKLLVV